MAMLDYRRVNIPSVSQCWLPWMPFQPFNSAKSLKQGGGKSLKPHGQSTGAPPRP